MEKYIKKNNLPNLFSCSVAVIGLGYVGFPLVSEIAKNNKCLLTGKKLSRKIIGYDLDGNRVEELKKGIDRKSDSEIDNFQKIDSLEFTDSLEGLNNIDVFIVTVPTPINDNKEPDLSFIMEASRTIGKLINSDNTTNDNQIIIYESTVYPGVTEDICVPLIEKFSNKKFNSDGYYNSFYCGYSPERINPGDSENTIDKIQKVTSGSNDNVAYWIDSFYASFIKAGTYKSKSIKVAEAAKVIENTQRDINIALVNELAILFKKLNLNTKDVLNTAATKWNFHNYKPGLVGGHCIGVDPYYLTFKAKEIGFKTDLITSGRRINDFMYKYLFQQILSKTRKREIIQQKEKVLILGISYKENCSDIRNSQILLLAKKMIENDMDVTIVDPLVDPQKIFEKIKIKSYKAIPEEKKFTLIILALNHKEFNFLSNQKIKKLSYPQTIIFDLTYNFVGENIFYL